MSLRDYLRTACEEVDAGIFSGDVLYCDGEREELKEYIGRWTRAISTHEQDEAVIAMKGKNLCAQDMGPEMQAEINELRAALAERDAEIERLERKLLESNEGFKTADQERDKAQMRLAIESMKNAVQRKVLEQAKEAMRKTKEYIGREFRRNHGFDAAITAIQEVLK